MRVDLDERESHSHDTELTLSTGSLLAIFFGIVLICGLCFGFGYSMGHRSKSAAASSAATSTKGSKTRTVPVEAGSTDNDTAANPATASARPSAAVAPERSNPKLSANDRAPEPEEGARATSRPHATKPAAAPAQEPAHMAAVAPKPRPVTDSSAPAEAGGSGTTSPASRSALMVQIAAVSRQEDATVLAAALRKRGFSPMVRHGAADSFFHVQLGPFSDAATANAMRDRLQSQGYNAIVK